MVSNKNKTKVLLVDDEKIIKSLPETKIIVVTGLHAKSKLDEAISAGAMGGIFKPFKDEELLEMIKKYV